LAQLEAAQRVDLIVTDLNMPVMDGITFIKHVRSRPSSKGTPVLMLTTESQDSKKQEGKAAGATGWLVKAVANHRPGAAMTQPGHCTKWSEPAGLLRLDVLRLDEGSFDSELPNGIFRAAHSIKGSAGIPSGRGGAFHPRA
jgi:hypothetical protein